ncbi:MAG TPA: hypothetical protein VET46_01730 [Steroidobacteraceae bacterium]|nr:hypothetical protein [Steroidobacteraceae bacterium]
MECSVEEIQPNVWRVSIASIVRIVRYRNDGRTFAPWEVTNADGQKLWSAASLESAFRWIEAHTGYPAEALFAQALLERGATGEVPRPNVPEESPEKLEDRRTGGS